MSSYQNHIRILVDDENVDPRHVEAWMRSEHGTLDALDPKRFAVEVNEAYMLALASGHATSELLARSFGL